MNTLKATVSLATVLALGVPAGWAATQAHQLSQTSGGTTVVVKSVVSPNGEWIVYMQDKVALPGVYELWSIRRGAGATRVRISEGLGSGYQVDDVKISPDSRLVIYSLETPSGTQLWSVPIEGPSAAATLLTPPIVEHVNFRLTPDGSRVVYFGEVGTIDVNEVWSVPVDGPSAAAVRLSKIPVGGMAEVWEYEIAPDSSRVVVLGDLDVAGSRELWSVPIDGPAASGVKLHPSLAGGRSVDTFEISPDSGRVVMRGDMVVDGHVIVQSVPLAGPAGSLVTLSLASAPTGDVTSFRVSPDSQFVVYHGDLLFDGRDQIWSVPIAGPAASSVRLGPTPPADGDLRFDSRISPDSAWVAFRGDNLTDGVEEVWVSPIAGPSASAVVVTPSHVNVGFGSSSLSFTPDRSRLVFQGDYSGGGAEEVWTYLIGDPERTAQAISGTVEPGRLIDHELAPDGSRVVIYGNLSFESRFWLYSAPTDGSGTRTTLTNFIVSPVGANVEPNWRISPDSQWVVYLADVTVDERYDLRRVAVGGGSGSLLHTAVQADRDVIAFAITDDSAGVVYRVEGTAIDLWIADEWIFASDFEESDTSEWSAQVP